MSSSFSTQEEVPAKKNVFTDSSEPLARDVLIAFIVVTVLVVAAIIIGFAILAARVDNVTTTVGTLVTSSNAVTSADTLCPSNARNPLFVQLVNAGNYAIVSTTVNVSGAQVQLGAAPTITLCNATGSQRQPVFLYTSALGDPITNSFGNSNNPPSGFILGNGGAPLGFAYTTQFISGQSLSPIFLAVASFNGGNSTAAVLTHENAPTFGGITYVRQTNLILGYSL